MFRELTCEELGNVSGGDGDIVVVAPRNPPSTVGGLDYLTLRDLRGGTYEGFLQTMALTPATATAGIVDDIQMAWEELEAILFGDGTEHADDLQSRYSPQAGQYYKGWVLYQPDGQQWIDLGKDGRFEARLWENPKDGDDVTDLRWNEKDDKWEPVPRP